MKNSDLVCVNKLAGFSLPPQGQFWIMPVHVFKMTLFSVYAVNVKQHGSHLSGRWNLFETC